VTVILDVSGMVAVVTGGASGIGKGVAQRLVERGAQVVIADIEEAPLHAAAEEIGADGFRTDVSDAASVQALADHVMDRFGKVNLVFNNAGIGPESPVAEMALADWRWIIDVNLWGVINGVHAFLPLLKRSGEPGYIVNTSSMGGFVADMPGLGAYATTKFAVTGLTEALAAELAREGSHVGAAVLAPGTVRTNIAQSLRTRPPEAEGGNFTQNDISERAEMTKLRWLEPTEVGDIVLDALARGETYIVTHPEWYPMVAARAGDIEAAFTTAAELAGRATPVTSRADRAG
jgi:NAD(P)-dependent dehydrogenase (short-subunit alcohol dehydrogenase family)